MHDERYKGWLANIYDYAHSEWRYPITTKRLYWFNKPEAYLRVRGVAHKRTNFRDQIRRQTRPAEEHMFKSIRTIINRTVKSNIKRFNLG